MKDISKRKKEADEGQMSTISLELKNLSSNKITQIFGL